MLKLSQKSQQPQSKPKQLRRVPGTPILVQKALEKAPKPPSIDPNGYYYLLGLKGSKNPSKDEIRSAFRAMAKIYHPDGENPNLEKFHKIEQAYSILINDETRYIYDRLKFDEAWPDETTIPLLKRVEVPEPVAKEIPRKQDNPTGFVYYIEEGVPEPTEELVKEWADLFIDINWDLNLSRGKEVRLGFSSTVPKVIQRPWGAILMVSGTPDKIQAMWLAITAEILSKSPMLATDML